MSAPDPKIAKLLIKLNSEYVRLHKKYEDYYWRFNMGDHSVSESFARAEEKLQSFRSNTTYAQAVDEALNDANITQTEKLKYWQRFFMVNKSTPVAEKIYQKIITLEKKISTQAANQKEGYIDPVTKKFVPASRMQMTMIRTTNPNEKLRRACFEALEDLPEALIDDYAILISLRNKYARAQGYNDFYDFKLQTQEQLTKEQVFSLFDEVYQETKGGFKEIQQLEKNIPRLNKPWNQPYYLNGDTITAVEEYFPFENALSNWLTSFGRLGIDFADGKLTLDLVERKGKLANGFCHWPTPVHYKGSKRQAGSANFTSNITPAQTGSSLEAYKTLFHEGGHAAHFLNNNVSEVCMNTEHLPASAAWAETQSMFIDTMLQSPEWLVTYGKSATNQHLTLEKYAEILNQQPISTDLFMNKITATAEFEKLVYESKVITPEKIRRTAKQMSKKYFNYSAPSQFLLNTPHLYRFEWSCSYHSYGLAKLAVLQWRDYFHKKYGYIVNNKMIGKEMKEVWQLGSTKSFSQFVKMATGKKLSTHSYIKTATMDPATTIRSAKRRLSKQPKQTKTIPTAASIHLVHGPATIATNKNGNDVMCERYARWYKKLLSSTIQ